MLTKLNNKAKRFFLLVWIGVFFIGVYFVFKVTGKDLIEEVVDLARKERGLNKKIIELMTFKLAKEQIPIAGDNEKYLLRDERDNIWLFKPDSKREVQNAKMISDVAQLLGISIPVLEGITLPINGKKVFGSIQKIGFDDILRLENVSIKKMSSIKIGSLQKLQVLDWLLVFNTNETGEDCFITSESGDEILGIDRDDCFRNPIDGKILDLEEGTDWESSLYARLWDSYIKGEIDINFWKVFELINYIQQIKDNEFKKILWFLEPREKEQFLEEVLWRKANLRKEFKKFYYDLAKKRAELIDIPLENDYEGYLRELLKKIKERISTKELEYKWLIGRGRKNQKNIEIVSAREMWYLVSCWVKKLYEEIRSSQEIIEKFRMKRKSCAFIGEHLAIELYIRQLRTKQRLNVYRIIEPPERLDPIEIEYNLRLSNYDIFLNNNLSKICMLKKKGNILAHLRYMRIMEGEEREKELISEYKQKFKANPNGLIGLFLFVMSQAEYFFNPLLTKVTITNTDRLVCSLDKIDSQFPWKYYGYALCDYGKGCIQDGIKNCERIIDLNNDKEAVYAAYMLLGFFDEHNSKNVQFGKGFDIKKAIKNYKEALEINPNSLEVNLNLANLYLIRKMPKEALQRFKKINDVASQYAQLHFHFGNVKGEDSYKDKEEYLEAIRMNTLSGEDHYILGLAYTIKGQNKLAEKHFDKAREFGCKKCQRSKR